MAQDEYLVALETARQLLIEAKARRADVERQLREEHPEFMAEFDRLYESICKGYE